jgi:protein arginine kinase activator
MGCDRCNQPATVHIKEISGGAVRELHLCEKCAAAQGMVAQKHATFFESVNALIVGKTADDIKDLKCEHCGMTWKEFKDTGLLGCVADYDIFAMQLTAWIESAQAGGNHHTGKIPAARATHGPDYLQAKERLLRMKAELSQAVSDEDFHHAAELRDKIKAMESQAGS